MIGSTISHYKILEKLGQGGMGVVYRALDTRLDRHVALKFLPSDLTRDPSARERFIHEAKAASALQHSNICAVHEIDQTDDRQMFIVMDCYEGSSLKDMIARGPMKVEEALTIATQIAAGLAKAHEKGIVHRDIKPGNILVTSDGVVKIVDFGVAKVSGATKLTKTGGTLGTIAYMAPEQLQGSEVDARADIFSLGVVLYETLTGRTAFHGDHEAALMYSIMNEQPEPLQQHIPDVPSELIHIVGRSLEKSPADRYKTMDEILIDLRRLKKDTASVRTLSGPVHKGSRKRMIVIGLAAGLGLVIVAGWFLTASHSDKTLFAPGRSVQLTHETGAEIDPALSPDGKMVAYSAFFKGALRIHVKQVAGGRPIPLTEAMPGYQRFPKWSEAGTEISFTSLPLRMRYSLPALGGIPRRIAEDVRSPDGIHTAIISGDTVIVRRTERGQGTREVIVFQPHSLAWSPDGSRIACVSGNINFVASTQLANIAPSAIVVISVSDGVVATISDTVSSNLSPVWAGDRHLFFVSSQDGAHNIYYADIEDAGHRKGNLQRLTTGLQVHSISLPSDGLALTYTLLAHASNIWSVLIPHDGEASSEGLTQVTTGNQVIENMAVTADGAWIAFDSNRPGNADIFKLPTTGGEPIQLTTDVSDDFVPNWSFDGKMIAFHSFRTGNRDIFVMQDDGTGLQQVTHDPTQEWYPSWSPDGLHIAVMSDRSGVLEPNMYGRNNVFVVSRRAGSADWEPLRQITFDGGSGPHWSPDGRWIAYIRRGLLVINPNGEEKRLLVEWKEAARSPRPAFPQWSPDSRRIFYSAVDESQQLSWWVVPMEGGEPRLIFTGGEETWGSNFGFATDGKKIYFTRSSYQGDIWKMELTRND